MGFLSNLVSAAVKVALTPIAVVKDAAEVVVGDPADNTKNLIEDAGEDIKDAIDDVT